MLNASARVVIPRPGTSGWWKCMSCSPCTTIMSASGGTMTTACCMASQVGTTPKTGGAYLPDV
jgi:hypothetical protein